MMHHPVDDHFAKQMRATGVQDPEEYGRNLETQYKIGLFDVWPPTLGNGCLPPADQEIQSQGRALNLHYKFLVAIDDVTTPQTGIACDENPWLRTSRTLSESRRNKFAKDMAEEIEHLQAEARNRLDNHRVRPGNRGLRP
jgi:hypothetical protein